ncbi:MAG: hypothetical protein PUF37_00870 [Prevotellaceae bacterium]|nr:hypothetical protein [Prevotellaceae bacterium]
MEIKDLDNEHVRIILCKTDRENVIKIVRLIAKIADAHAPSAARFAGYIAGILSLYGDVLGDASERSKEEIIDEVATMAKNRQIFKKKEEDSDYEEEK